MATTTNGAMTTDDATTRRASERAEMYFLAHNVAKKHNIGTMARCCTAFGVKSLVLIGSRQFNTFGSHGADGHVHFEHFDSLEEAREKLKGGDSGRRAGDREPSVHGEHGVHHG